MMSDRITGKDLARALEAHRTALEKVGITYDGRLILSEGSKTCGLAYRLNLTDMMWHCQAVRWLPDTAEGYSGGIDHSWNHEDREVCNGTRRARCSGHDRPPVGDDYLGMTAREAYETLTARTRAVYDMAVALDSSKGGQS